MNAEAERFIELATRPLSHDAETRAAAAEDLRRRIGGNPATPEILTEAADALEHAEPHPRWRDWRVAAGLLALLVFLPVVIHAGWQLRQLAGVNHLLAPDVLRSLSVADPHASLTPAQRLLLVGDESADRESDRWKPLWDSEPGNRAYFQEYAAAWYRDFKSLSPAILETAARVDPDNAWYQVIDAAAKAKKAVKKENPGYYERKQGKRPTFTVTDEDGLADALVLLHEAGAKSRLSGGDVELLRERIRLLPPRMDFISQLPLQVLTASRPCNLIDLRHLADAVSIQAGHCAEKKDVAGFRQLVADWKWLVTSSARDGESLIDVLVAKAIFTMPLVELRDAAKALGLEQDAVVFDGWQKHHETRRERSRRSFQGTDIGYLIESKGSIMANLSVTSIARQAESPPPITEAGLKPGRYADHALMGRIHAILSWLLLGLCAVLAAIGVSREGVPSCVVSRRLHDLIRPGDWVRILSSGVLLPLLWFLFITRLTPLAAREWGMKPSGFLLPVIQLSSLTLLMLTACAVSASRVLGKRAGFLGLKPRLPKTGVIAVMAEALAIPVTGAAPWIPPLANLMFTAGCGLAGAAVLWLLWGFSAHVLRRPRDASLRRAMLARMVIPAWFCGMLVMAVMAPVHYAGERHWIQQDRLMEISADAPAMSRHEWDVTLQLRKELLEMIR